MKLFNHSLLGVLFVFSMCGQLFADDKSKYELLFENEETSDSYSRNTTTITYRNHRRDLFWPYNEESQTGLDFGFKSSYTKGDSTPTDFGGAKALGLIGYKFDSNNLLDFSTGIHQLENSVPNQKSAAWIGQIQYSSIMFEKLTTNVELNRDYVYEEMALPRGATDFLMAITSKLNITYRPIERIRIISRSSLRWYNDSNRRRETDLSVMYGIATTTPWIWAGLGLSHLDFSNQVTGYWTPERFHSYGPRIEIAAPLLEKLEFFGGLNHNTFQENKLKFGQGFTSSAGLRYGTRDDWSLSLSNMHIESAQSANLWMSNLMNLNLTVNN